MGLAPTRSKTFVVWRETVLGRFWLKAVSDGETVFISHSGADAWWQRTSWYGAAQWGLAAKHWGPQRHQLGLMFKMIISPRL